MLVPADPLALLEILVRREWLAGMGLLAILVRQDLMDLRGLLDLRDKDLQVLRVRRAQREILVRRERVVLREPLEHVAPRAVPDLPARRDRMVRAVAEAQRDLLDCLGLLVRRDRVERLVLLVLADLKDRLDLRALLGLLERPVRRVLVVLLARREPLEPRVQTVLPEIADRRDRAEHLETQDLLDLLDLRELRANNAYSTTATGTFRARNATICGTSSGDHSRYRQRHVGGVRRTYHRRVPACTRRRIELRSRFYLAIYPARGSDKCHSPGR